MKDKPGRELSTIAKLWAAFIRLPLTDLEDPMDPPRVEEPVIDQHGSAASPAGCPPVYGRRVGKPVFDQHGEDDRDRQARFWAFSIGGLIVLVGMGWASWEHQNMIDRDHNAAFSTQRFLTDNAHGATANAVEMIAHRLDKFDQGSAVMRFCVLCLLWLIFLALLRINAAIESQTKRLLSSAEREKQPPPK